MKTLTNPTDAELSAAVAKHVAKLYPNRNDWDRLRELNSTTIPMWPPFSTSADAVMPLLQKHDFTVAHLKGPPWEAVGFEVCIHRYNGNSLVSDDGFNITSFPRAACIALLRAHGIEVIKS